MVESMKSFEELMVAQSEKTAETRKVDVEFGGEVITLEFTEIRGDVWATIARKHPARPGVELDMSCGYNMTAAGRDGAKISGVRVDGDEREELTPAQWDYLLGADATADNAEIAPALDGNNFRIVTEAVWSLNEWEPFLRRDSAKKGSTAAPTSRRKRS